MSFLEDRILQIIEKRKNGLGDIATAEELGLKTDMIKLYEESTRKVVNDAISNGVSSINEIASRVGISTLALNIFMNHYGINVPEKKMQMLRIKGAKSEERIKAVREEINKGAKSVREIAKKTNIPLSIIYSYEGVDGIKLPRSHMNKEKRVEAIRQAVNSGAESIEEIAEKVNLSMGSIREYATEFGIELPKKPSRINYKRREKVGELAKQGLTLERIGNSVGVKRERARQLLHKAGYHKIWQEAKEKIKREQEKEKEEKESEEQQRKEILGTLVSSLETRVSQLAKKEGWVYEKAVEYKRLIPRTHKTHYSFDELVKLFKAYEDARNNGVRVSLEEFGERFDLWAADVGKIFRRVGVKPMYGKIENMTRLSKEEIKVLERGFPLGMSDPDIAYFVGVPHHAAQQRFTKRDKRRKVNPFIKRFGRGKRITYRSASQIYEALDLGFTQQETIELFDTTQEVANYVIEKRKKIEPKIINTLRVLSNDNNIDKPYLISAN